MSLDLQRDNEDPQRGSNLLPRKTRRGQNLYLAEHIAVYLPPTLKSLPLSPGALDRDGVVSALCISVQEDRGPADTVLCFMGDYMV